MTIRNKVQLSAWDRRVTVNISIPLKILAAIDEKVESGKRSEFITDILLEALDLKEKEVEVEEKTATTT